MVGIILFIVALCAVAQDAVAKGVEVDNEWNIISKLLTDKINTNTRRIAGGQTATLGQFPHQALLILKSNFSDGQSLCGGSIISQNWILTAAHWFVH